MLCKYLKGAMAELCELISLTTLDIADIKRANHSEIFSRAAQKTAVLQNFHDKKNLAQQEIQSLKNAADPKAGALDFLNDESRALIDLLRENLEILKAQNEEFARLSFYIKEFYDSMLDSMFPQDFECYEQYGRAKTSQRKSAFLYQEA